MPGFFISSHKINIDIWEKIQEQCIFSNIIFDRFYIQRKTLNRFMQDKIFESDNGATFVITEGIILNKNELVNFDTAKSVTLLSYILNHLSDNYFDKFRGSFSGAHYNSVTKTWVIYTNQLGDKPVFYYHDKSIFICSSSLIAIARALHYLGIKLHMNVDAAYNLLTYGSMCSEGGTLTPIKEVKRLAAGTYLKYTTCSKELSVHVYYKFTNNPYRLSDLSNREIINELDEKFRVAIMREYDKDIEYGYKHLASLSGGLDSRMNNWVAYDMGYRDILNITFSQSNYLDQKIAEKISKHLGNELIFYALDNTKYLQDVDEIIERNYGLSIYSGTAHSYNLLKNINIEKYGVIHTGQLGDVVISSFCNKKNAYINEYIPTRIYSDILINKIKNIDIGNYDNQELFMIYTRGVGALTSQIAISNITESTSPFIDVDFMQFCLQIPIELREHHKIYKDWINYLYPKAAQYKWESTDAKINAPEIEILLKKVYHKGIYKLLNKFGFKCNLLEKNITMNPMNYWYNYNASLRSYMNSYFNENIELIKDITLKQDTKYLYSYGMAREKLQVLSVLGVFKYYEPFII